jgi:biotin carboxylase
MVKPGDTLRKQLAGNSSHKRVFSSDGPNLIRIMSNDRPELRGPLIKRMTTVDSSKEVVVIVDPFSTGTVIADEVVKRGFSVICLWSKAVTPQLKTHVPLSCGKPNYMAEIDATDDLMKTSEAVYKAAGMKKIVACFAGGDTGVDLADALSESMKVRTNGTKIANRRDKKVQQETIRKHGLRSIRQAGGTKFSDVQAFLEAESYPVVVKPVESLGSDGVQLCNSYDEAKEHFEALLKYNSIGSTSQEQSVLCQEYLRGDEFVIDHVSRDGDHKTCMIYKYDKRAHNGAPFVYFGVLPVDSDSPEARILIPYCRGVLDALGIKNGATHAEIMLTPDGPCLVEMNVRAHGGDGNWRPLAAALTGGYTQVDASVDAYLDKAKFSTIPNVYPSPFKAAGQEVYLVSNGRGIVKDTPGFEVLKDLPSFVYLETGVRKGSSVDFTVDLFSALGSVILMHPDANVLEDDVKKIREMEQNNEFVEFELHSGYLK